MIYGYARVSTQGQATKGNSLEDQVKLLKSNGATEIYEEAYTGTEIERPEFSKLLEVLEAGDTLMACKYDRISRSATKGSEIVKELLDKGVRVHILNMGVVDDTPIGKLLMTVLFGFAEFERDCIVERTQSGKEIARQKPGYREGRPKLEVETEALKIFYEKQKRGELSSSECAKELGISRASYYNLIKRAGLSLV